MSNQVTFIVDTLKFIQDGKVITWRTPFLAIQYVIKIISEKLGSLQASKMKVFTPEEYGGYTLMLARNSDDLHQAQKLYVQAFEDRHGAVLLEKLYKQYPQLFFIVMKDEKLVGYCLYTIDPWFFSAKRTACFYSLAVDKAFQGGGHARHMVEKTMAFLKENSVSKVYLHVYPDNKNAIHLYEKFGFKLVRVMNGINPKRNHMLLMETHIPAQKQV
jgi:ribosomal protein S18 acetylase RimI-like enzyme